MEEHWIYQDHGAYQKYPQFKKTVQDIVHAKRDSIMSAEELDEFFEQRRYLKRLNEDTYLHNLLPLIVSRKYTKKEAKPTDGDRVIEEADLQRFETAAEDSEPSETKARKDYIFTSRRWIQDGILVKMNATLLPAAIPNRFEGEGYLPQIAAALAKEQGLTEARPDYLYAIKPDAYRDETVTLSPHLQALLGVAPGVQHPFFIVEGKSEQGSVADAQNQARRGGASLVHTTRSLLAHLGEPDVEGLDMRTFIFSATMSPDIMEIWVHWAEVIPTGVRFHMNQVASRALAEEEQVVQLRKILHNILDWGVNKRRPQLQLLHQIISSFQKAQTRREIEETKAKANKKRKATGASLQGSKS